MIKKSKNFILIFSILFISFKTHSMTEMMIMMGAQTGASIANQSINQTFQLMSQSIAKLQTNLSNSMAHFTTNMKSLQEKEMTEMVQLFKEAQSHVQSQQSDQGTYFQQMESYLYQAIDTQKPPQYYLLNKAPYLDELFSLGTMYTPQGPTWKNVFVIGNWEYDHKTNTFWQMQNVPFNNEQNDSFMEKQYHQAANSIFTEYFTTLPSYEIACEITIHQVQYPFFVGVEFNRTRWISGDIDSITKCRLYGIYGASQNHIGTYFAEQYDKKVAVSKTESGTTTLYPLSQITNPQTKPLQPLSNKVFDEAEHQPIVLLMKIKTSPTTMQFKIWQKGEEEPKNFITKKSKNKDLYLYHNIGFLSSGAIAQFKLLQPTELLFSEQAKQDFTTEVESLITPTPKRPKTVKKKIKVQPS